MRLGVLQVWQRGPHGVRGKVERAMCGRRMWERVGGRGDDDTGKGESTRFSG